MRVVVVPKKIQMMNPFVPGQKLKDEGGNELPPMDIGLFVARFTVHEGWRKDPESFAAACRLIDEFRQAMPSDKIVVSDDEFSRIEKALADPTIIGFVLPVCHQIRSFYEAFRGAVKQTKPEETAPIEEK